MAFPISCVAVATLPEGVTDPSDPHEQAIIIRTSEKDAIVSNTFLLGFIATLLVKWWDHP
ncbi:MAG: hypothetical protein ABSA01_13950 [Anaerolineales bacterium]